MEYSRRNTKLYQNRPEESKNRTNFHLGPHDYRIYYVNIDLRHQYGISVVEVQTFLLAKRSLGEKQEETAVFAG